MRKLDRKTLIKKLDKLYSERVKSIGYCQRCGKFKNQVQLQTAHIYSRRYKHLRWESENAVCLCAGCHFWAHQNPVEFSFWVAELKDITKLRILRQNTEPIKTYQLQTLYDLLKG